MVLIQIPKSVLNSIHFPSLRTIICSQNPTLLARKLSNRTIKHEKHRRVEVAIGRVDLLIYLAISNPKFD